MTNQVYATVEDPEGAVRERLETEGLDKETVDDFLHAASRSESIDRVVTLLGRTTASPEVHDEVTLESNRFAQGKTAPYFERGLRYFENVQDGTESNPYQEAIQTVMNHVYAAPTGTAFGSQGLH